MPTLAISTSANFVSLALLEESQILAARDSRLDFRTDDLPAGKQAGDDDRLPTDHSRSFVRGRQKTRRVFPPGASVMLAPMIDQLLADHQLTMSEIGLICVDIGPGLFTGLRVGVVTARTLAYASQTDLIAVNTLDAVAAQTFENLAEDTPQLQEQTVQVVFNAQRKQLFAAGFRYAGPWNVTPVAWPGETTGGEASEVTSARLCSHREWIDAIGEGDLATGTGLKGVAATLNELRPAVRLAPESCWELRAASVGRLGWQAYQNGRRDDLWSIEPCYFRPSAAEEAREKRVAAPDMKRPNEAPPHGRT